MKQRTLPKPVAKTAVYVAVAAVVPLACVVAFAVWLRWPWPTATGLALVGGFFAGRASGLWSSREELAAAHLAWEAQNASPERDELALPPERTGEHPQVELYDQDAAEPDWRRDLQRAFSLEVTRNRHGHAGGRRL